MGYSDDELYKMHLKGQISDDEYLAGIEKNCGHKNSTVEQFENGAWKEWCDDCGKVLDSSSGASGKVKVSSGGGWCSVVALFILGAVLSGIYAAVRLIT
jgi:hypothetical protein